jgi:hypothetical protein
MKNGYKGRLSQTVLLVDIIDIANPNETLTDHLWFNFTEEFKHLNLKSGDILEFNARVALYKKGYSDDSEDNPKRIDYHLTYPRKIEKCGHSEKDYSSYEKYNEEIIKKVEEHETRRKEAIAQWRDTITQPAASLTPSSSEPKKKITLDKKITEFLK